MTRFDPYFNFSGNAVEAMNFYQSVFGGEVTVTNFKDFPGGTEGLPESEHGLAMHVSLDLPDGSLLMASDVPSKMGTVTFGNAVNIMVNAQSAEEARRFFEGLTADAKQVGMPLGETGFAELYASFQDRYGIHWMVFFAGNKAPA